MLHFEIQTLNFEEFLEMKDFLGLVKNESLVADFEGYILHGTFPKTLQY